MRLSKITDKEVLDIIEEFGNIYQASLNTGIPTTSLWRRVKLINDSKDKIEVNENKDIKEVNLEFGSWIDNNEQRSKTETEIKANKTLERQKSKHSLNSYYNFLDERHDLKDNFLIENNGRYKTMIVFSDVHDVEADDFTLEMLFMKCKELQPDVICLNGDLFDLPEFSRWNQDPRDFNLVERMNKGLNVLKMLRDICPKSQIDFIEGNHDIRVVKYLSEEAPQMLTFLSDFLGLDNADLFKLNIGSFLY